MIFGSRSYDVEASTSFQHFRTSCNVILVLLHVTDIVLFYVKTVFMFQKTKKINKQATKTFSDFFSLFCVICSQVCHFFFAS